MKKYILTIILFITSLTIACEEYLDTRYTSYDLKLSDGSKGIGVRCVEGFDFCKYEAGRRCPVGYNIIEQGSAQQQEGNKKGYDHYTRWYMIIQCK